MADYGAGCARSIIGFLGFLLLIAGLDGLSGKIDGLVIFALIVGIGLICLGGSMFRGKLGW